MILSDGYIKLRAVEITDADCLLGMINSPEIESSVVGWSFPVASKDQIDWINSIKNDSCVRYTIDINNEAVGLVIISAIDFKNSTANISVKLSDDCPKRKGIGSKAVKLIQKYCFYELNLNCLTANILEYNIASQKTFEKCGFSKDAVLRKRIFKNGRYLDLYVYSILRDEYNGDW